jgi:hypothetical protein
MLLDYGLGKKAFQVDWTRLIRLATEPDPDEPGSGGHFLLGAYLRSMRDSGGRLTGHDLTALGFAKKP